MVVLEVGFYQRVDGLVMVRIEAKIKVRSFASLYA